MVVVEEMMEMMVMVMVMFKIEMMKEIQTD